MRTVTLTWEQSLELGVVLLVVGAVMARAASHRIRTIGACAREAAVIGILFAAWQVAGKVSLHDTGGAYDRGAWIERFDRHLVLLPSESTFQHWFLGHHTLIQGANLYYGSVHLTSMLVFLIWLFWFHRDRYRQTRQVMAWTTLGCLLVQLLPVAPPRMYPGFVDTAMAYGQSVYANGLPIDQLSAMPSVHVAWACFIGYYMWRVGTSRWRYVGPIHTALTIFVVVVTANHWWLDGIVAALILVTAAWSVTGVSSAWRRHRGVGRSNRDEAILATA